MDKGDKGEFRIVGSLLAKNTVLNFIGLALPLLVAIVTLPYAIHGLGLDRFGILSLIWVVLGYFSLFDLGLGRATTKFVAEALGKGETESISDIVWTSLSSQIILGMMGGLALLGATPLLIEKILNIPPSLLEEARISFYILSISVPIIICSANLRGILESAQRFDLVNTVKIPSNVLVFLIPAVAVFFEAKLPIIIFFIVVSWLFASAAYLLLSFKIYPILKVRIFSIDTKLFRPLFTFGGWITVCNFLIPVLVALDRFFIGALLSVTFVGYYTAPYELISRLQIIPASFALTLFPVFATVATSDKKGIEQYYIYSLKYLLMVMGPIVFIIIFFSSSILQIWLGVDFAAKTSLVLQILALGILLNALAQMPAFLLDSVGRPDLRAKIFLFYVVFYIGLLWFLINKLGIVGAALAWTIRAGFELVLFFFTTHRIMSFSWTILKKRGILQFTIAYGMIASMGLLLTFLLGKTFFLRSAITTGCLILFFYYMWRWALEEGEKRTISIAIKSFVHFGK